MPRSSCLRIGEVLLCDIDLDRPYARPQSNPLSLVAGSLSDDSNPFHSDNSSSSFTTNVKMDARV